MSIFLFIVESNFLYNVKFNLELLYLWVFDIFVCIKGLNKVCCSFVLIFILVFFILIYKWLGLSIFVYSKIELWLVNLIVLDNKLVRIWFSFVLFVMIFWGRLVFIVILIFKFLEYVFIEIKFIVVLNSLWILNFW